MNKFHGTGVALVTPFNTDGSVDYQGLKKLINHLVDGGIDYLVSLGTTGETATLSKAEKKKVFRHSGFPGGIKEQTFADLLEKKPEDAVRNTVRGMLPKNSLGADLFRKLKVYAGAEHPHAAQQPTPYTFGQVAQ